MTLLDHLQHLSLQPGGFDRDSQRNPSSTFRKAAWLYLLHVDQASFGQESSAGHPASLVPPVSAEATASPSASLCSSSDLPPRPSPLRSSEEASRTQSPDDSLTDPLSTPATSPRPDLLQDGERIPLDQDGWQIAAQPDPPSGSADDHLTGAVPTPPAHDQWTTVQSKRAKASRRRRASIQASQSADLPQKREEPCSPRNGSGSGSPAGPVSTPPEASPGSGPPILTEAPAPIGAQPTFSEADPTTSGRRKRKKKKANSTAKASSDTLDDPRPSALTPSRLASLPAHRDEEQVDKDIRRSFVGPAFSNQAAFARSARRKQLEEVVLFTLRRHPSLSYYQGYHDVLGILVLTLAPRLPSEPGTAAPWTSETERHQVQLAAERLSLHFVRDSMTDNLDPIMGQLKLVRNLIRLEDPTLAQRVELASPLPFFALSWLLTLFSHDLEAVELVQRCFDFLLAHGPHGAVYLCAAVVLLVKRDEVDELGSDQLEDPAVLHMVLGKLPAFSTDEVGPRVGKQQEERRSSSSSSSEVLHNRGSTPDSDRLYTDPDVDPPSWKSDTIAPPTDAEPRPPLPLHRLLSRAKDLMDRHPLSDPALTASKTMGPKSVLFTWPLLVSELHRPSAPSDRTEWWEAQNALAARTVVQVSAIVHDPSPTPPPYEDGSDPACGKTTRHRYRLVRDGGKGGREVALGTVVAVVGVVGVVVALYTEGREGQFQRVLGGVAGLLGWLGGTIKGPGS